MTRIRTLGSDQGERNLVEGDALREPSEQTATTNPSKEAGTEARDKDMGRLDHSLPSPENTAPSESAPETGSDATDLTSDGSDGPHTHTRRSAKSEAAATANTTPPAAQTSKHRRLVTEYGGSWTWDPEIKDYIRLEQNGDKLVYTKFQRTGGNPSASVEVPGRKGDPGGGQPALLPLLTSAGSSEPPQQAVQKRVPPRPPPDELEEPGDKVISVNTLSRRGSTASDSSDDYFVGTSSIPRILPKKAYEHRADPRFRAVDKPKRFFYPGRIFKAVWFEPAGESTPGRRADLEWTDDCPPFHDSKPQAKFRWFVVVRKRLHHSLCFSITTFGGAGTSKTRRGRAVDFVVLYSAEIEPPRPFPEEDITRDPIAVIIEDEEQFISPLARLDCSRIYTVEDNLKVMKIGRVHPDSWTNLDTYYKESVS